MAKDYYEDLEDSFLGCLCYFRTVFARTSQQRNHRLPDTFQYKAINVSLSR